ncbi:MAG: metal-dependent transcriptional regulator [Fimbriimonadales bacterium]|nr:metal-dependent transcriptional regulator [Fimbriimonadales bacterium]
MAVSEHSLRVPASCRPGDHHKTKRGTTEIVEEYVEGIFRLQEAIGQVTTGELADYMQVSAGSATSMVKKLHQMGLAKYEPYKSVSLTKKGERLAKQLSRTHRILKKFLVDSVGLPWNDVHELACKLEHYIDSDVIEIMYAKLGRPERCPHGTPINLDAPDNSFRLAEAEVGVPHRIVKITNERHEFLKFLEDLSMLPGSKIKILELSPIDSLMRIEVAGKPFTVGPEVGRHVWVELA